MERSELGFCTKTFNGLRKGFLKMRSLKNNLIVICILFSGLLGEFGFGKEWKRIKIAFEPYYPPFSYIKKDGKIAGMEIDLARALCKEMRVRCSYHKQDWDGLIPALFSRKYDAIMAGMSITEERKKKIEFSKPYFFLGGVFVGKRNMRVRISSDTERNRRNLRGKRLGVQNSTTMEYHLNKHYSNVVEIRKYPSNDKIILDLLSGRIDLGFFESLIASYILKDKNYRSLSMIGPAFFSEDLVQDGVGIGMRKRDGELHRMIDNAFMKIRRSGLYKKILSKYVTNSEYEEMMELSR